MKHFIRLSVALCLLACAGSLFGQAQVSEKQEIAIFALGYYGYTIPAQALGTIDVDIQRVFLDLGRFTIMGMQQRFAAGDINTFIETIRRSKEENFVMPERFMFGEAFLTDDEFNKIVGAFIVAVPVVTSFNSQFSNNEWKTDIKTNVSFIQVSSGELIGLANVETSGTSRETQFKSIQSAIDGIPMQLQYEIRSISQFQLRTRVLTASGGTVRLELGTNMGIKLGDEYRVLREITVGDFVDVEDAGVLLISNVGERSSEAVVLYSDIPLAQDVPLQELPRQGADIAFYGNYYSYLDINYNSNPSTIALGFRTELTRGFFNLRPYAAFQVLLDMEKAIPINLFVGGMYSMYMGRLEVGGRAAVVGGSNVILAIIDNLINQTDDTYLSHYGLSAGGYASWLLTRDMKLFVNAQLDFMLGVLDGLGAGEAWNTYGGIQIGVGATFKL
ncbi:MAG: hypothetical protein A2087_01665 [Spirochaetes bacterium GWD1_61_31]|nr:MAG: hypothetical protein A2Y37_10420 [Spirochaetes bacterium GWB1_60_80]OHD29738.1 MAG: hypothetical protein A2004_04695 [Spirochaetes bacterium GWC1_61_12]OHD35782.1 MAG: hypothetical protein A2087_01665 [Spirochaetes bacterium GWD1_61_31]OHD42919.1 MAG: hypothetical protein A2Y35_14100 [Spirochaetes bacterium GWE1_60_18]OHD61281.1 MAG: hypothetical protein A2Y32_04115 [Spirochaetes bacterium GWF1_60_12]HAP43787.1 hypothetical protein [Spirochaetaceae bacterium]